MASIPDQTPRTAKNVAELFAEASRDMEDVQIGAERKNGAEAEEETLKILLKDALVAPAPEDFELLVDRLQVRLREGRGECLYEVGTAEHSDEAGISEEQMEASVQTLRAMAERLNARISLIRNRTLNGNHGMTADWLVRVQMSTEDFMEVRVAVVGNVDAGKSTLLGVLTHGELDDGRGHSRLKLFRHKHEIESGRTSSVGNDILGFDAVGTIVNNPDPHDGHLDWVKICQTACKVFTFIDLAGHEKYLKTTIFGMTGHMPDYSMLMVGSNAGVVGMTKEHLGLALALNVPVFLVVTKIDMCPGPVLHETLQLLQKILKSPGCRKLPVMVQSVDDVIVSALNFQSERICPIFQVSNVTGENLDLLKMFLNLLSVRSKSHDSDPAEFQIDDTYMVPGVGTVVSGTCLKGLIKLNDTLLLGPNSSGLFQPVPIKSIHRKRMPVREVRGGQTASFALKKIKRSEIRKGMVMVSQTLNPQSCWEFHGEILVLHHPTTISTKYQAMVHCGPIRQTATIVDMDKDCLRTGDKAYVKFRFVKNPEYLRENTRLVFREGRTKAVGNVLKIIPYTPTVGLPQKVLRKKAIHQSERAGGSSGEKRRRDGHFSTSIPILVRELETHFAGKNVGIAFPDEAASNAFDALFPRHWPRIVCARQREDGKRFAVIANGDPSGLEVVLVDNSVSSGITFLEAAKVIRAAGAASVNAYVTHAAFPGESWRKFLEPSDLGGTFWLADTSPLAREIAQHKPFKLLESNL